MITGLYYRASTFREAGLEAKWSKTQNGRPYLVARKSGASDQLRPGKTWFVITANMFDRMQKIGILEAFNEYTLLGDVLSISAN